MLETAQRQQIGRMCELLAMEGKFNAIALILDDLQIGTAQERQNVIAEWRANYAHHAYSVWPRHACPRQPRPNGEDEEC